MRRIIIPTIAIAALGAFADPANPQDPVIGNWGLKLPYQSMYAGHVEFTRGADNAPQALLLWRAASPFEVKKVSIDGAAFKLEFGKKVVEGKVDGDKLVAVARDASGEGKMLGEVTGWRNPQIGESSLKDAKFGDPIDLLADGMDGWVLMNPQAKNGWLIKDEDGVKVLSNSLGLKPDGKWAGGGSNLKTKREDFYDFAISYDVRVPKKSNSGVYLRGRYEIQVLDSYGEKTDCHNMAALYGRIVPAVAAEKPAGEWQHVDAVIFNRHVTVSLNGKLIIDNQPVVGVTGGAIDADEFAPGPIYLQGDHSDADFRNMILRPIKK